MYHFLCFITAQLWRASLMFGKEFSNGHIADYVHVNLAEVFDSVSVMCLHCKNPVVRDLRKTFKVDRGIPNR